MRILTGKKIIIILLTACLIFTIPFSIFAETESETEKTQANPQVQFELESKSAILVENKTGRILFEKNIHEKLPPASVTKVMSMLLFMEALDSGRIKYDDVVVVSEHAQGMGGSQVYLAPGEHMSVRDLMKAVAIASANDATVALAEEIAGSEETFVRMMNDKAKELGMENTNFVNSSGLDDDNHYTTAYDISLMSRELINKHPNVIEFTTIWMDSLRGGEFGLANTNKLIRFYNGATGIKTGSTSKAKFCLSASARRNNLDLIAVILAGPDSQTRFSEASKLLNHGFANYQNVAVRKRGDSEGEVSVAKGLRPSVGAVHPEDLEILVTKGDENKVKAEVVLADKIEAPIQKGQKVGEVIYTLNNEEIARAEIVAEEDIDKATIVRIFLKILDKWVHMGR